MNVKEFAKRRKVNEQTVRKWVRNGRIEGWTTDHLGRLDIPESALANCPLPVRKVVFNPGYSEVELKMKKTIIDQRDQELAEVKAERATLFAQHMELLTKHAGLRGKCDQLEIDLEKEHASVMSQHLLMDRLKEIIRSREDEIDALRRTNERLQAELSKKTE